MSVMIVVIELTIKTFLKENLSLFDASVSKYEVNLVYGKKTQGIPGLSP
jgi:hypothetical protein